MKKKGKAKCLAYGGQIAGQLTGSLANFIDGTSIEEDGYQDKTAAGLAGAARYAGIGASIGNMLLPGIGGAVGAGIGALGGGLYSAQQAQKQNSVVNMRLQKKKEFEQAMERERSRSIISTYPTQGVVNSTAFAYGGMLPANPSQLSNITGKVTEVQGQKHEEGGVPLMNPNGEQIAEVEKGEVIFNNRVFSDRLQVPGTTKSYADIAAEIAKSPKYKKLEENHEKWNSILANPRNNQFVVGTATRSLEANPNPLESLYASQEILKQQTDMAQSNKQFGYGGPLPSNLPLDKVNKFLLMKKKFDDRYPMPDANTDAVGDRDAMQAAHYTNTLNGVLGSVNKMTGKMQQRRLNEVAKTYPTPENPVGFDFKEAVSQTRQAVQPLLKRAENAGQAVAGTAKTVGDRTVKGLTQLGDKAPSLASLVPLADNLVNAALIKRTPQIPVPKMLAAPRLKTDYDVSSQIANIESQYANRLAGLKSAGGSSIAIRNSLLAGQANDMTAYGQLQGEKRNMETQLINQQRNAEAAINAQNTGLLNDYEFKKMQRIDDVHERISANVANAVEDFQMARRDKNAAKLDNQKLAIAIAQYDKDGVLERSHILEALKDVEAGMDIGEALTKQKALALKKKTPLLETLPNRARQLNSRATNINPPALPVILPKANTIFDYMPAINYNNYG